MYIFFAPAAPLQSTFFALKIYRILKIFAPAGAYEGTRYTLFESATPIQGTKVIKIGPAAPISTVHSSGTVKIARVQSK